MPPTLTLTKILIRQAILDAGRVLPLRDSLDGDAAIAPIDRRESASLPPSVLGIGTPGPVAELQFPASVKQTERTSEGGPIWISMTGRCVVKLTQSPIP